MSASDMKAQHGGDGAGGDAIDQRALRRCLSQFATGVSIVTTKVGGARAGVTANSFSSLSLEPPLVLWSLGRTSRSFPAFSVAARFAISILTMDQIAVSQHFSGPAPDKFAGAKWRPGLDGVPLIEDALATIECSMQAVHDGGDHLLFVGRVERFSMSEGEPLIFAQGRYCMATEHPGLMKRPGTAMPEEDSEEVTFSRLVFQAHRRLSLQFEESRRLEGVTMPQQKVLTALYRARSLSPGDIARKMFLGVRDATDALQELVAGGLVERLGEDAYTLTAAGRQARKSLGRRLVAFEADRLAGIPRSELDTCARVLEKLGRDGQA